MPRRINQLKKFEAALKTLEKRDSRYVLKLYVTGSTQRSARAIESLREFCEMYLHGRYDLEVIDIHQQPILAKGEQIIAAPTLVRRLPAPIRKMVGDLSDIDRVLMGLDIKTTGPG